MPNTVHTRYTFYTRYAIPQALQAIRAGSDLNITGLGVRDDWTRERERQGYIGKVDTYLAAEAGNTAVLAWLRARECPWDFGTITHATKNGHPETVEWLLDNGCPMLSINIEYAEHYQQPETAALLRARDRQQA